MNNPHNGQGGRAEGFTLFEVLLALAVYAIAVIGLITALNTTIQSALEVRQRAMIRMELESRIAFRTGVPPDRDKLVLEARDNHGVRVEETLIPHPVRNKDGGELQNIKKLTITATIDNQSESTSILINKR
jgi:type II secretory pathway pseudopilin PulG